MIMASREVPWTRGRNGKGNHKIDHRFICRNAIVKYALLNIEQSVKKAHKKQKVLSKRLLIIRNGSIRPSNNVIHGWVADWIIAA